MQDLTDNRLFRWVRVVAWMAVIFALSSQSRLPSLSLGWADALQDIVGHFVVFGILAALLFWALRGADVAHASLWTLAIVMLYALSDEFHQAFVPGRHPDPFDIATDAAGAGCALILLSYLHSRHRRQQDQPPPPLR